MKRGKPETASAARAPSESCDGRIARASAGRAQVSSWNPKGEKDDLEIGERESRELLRKQNLGRLGCSGGGEPYVVPVHYHFDDEDVYVHSTYGRKIEIMRANPHVCLQADEIVDPFNWRSVIAFGVFEEVGDPAEKDRILTAMFKRLPHLTPVESEVRASMSETIVFRIRIGRVTGVCERWT
jgi:nitroimidazol reductase NimA-like FMN-containing flavoprotein (pyridoxamine 5'-phosphate oxidase superfamily)